MAYTSSPDNSENRSALLGREHQAEMRWCARYLRARGWRVVKLAKASEMPGGAGLDSYRPELHVVTEELT